MIPIAPELQHTGQVLVVDDEEINRATLAEILGAEGHSVSEAATGQDALSAILAGGIDVVLLDVILPDIDGFDICQRVRQQYGLVFLPIVFVTALGDHAARVRGLAAGGDDFLTKPVDPIELRSRVRNLLRAKAYHDLQARQNELLEAELERNRAELIRADRLATLGNLAAGVGHELKNLSTLHSWTMELIAADTKRGAPIGAEELRALEWIGTHLAMHALHLQALSRPTADRTETLDLRAVVRETLDLLRMTGATKYVSASATLPPTALMVCANRERLEQIIVNLVGNAVDALDEAKPACKELRVTLRADAERVACAVTDNGSGMTPEVKEKLFQMYFTTKAPGKGSGLGLSVVRNIVESFGGSLSVESEVGEGTTVCFELPLSASDCNGS